MLGNSSIMSVINAITVSVSTEVFIRLGLSTLGIFMYSLAILLATDYVIRRYIIKEE